MAMKGLNAFITGGAMGLGRAFTEALLVEGAEKVYIADVNEKAGRDTVDELERQFGKGRCTLMVVDITNAAQFEESFQAAASESGHIDLMVNNAGTFNEITWEPVINLNVTALVRGCQLAMKHMSRQNGGRGGRIINTCSDMGVHGCTELPVYSATKHAVRAYTTNMAEQPNLHLTSVQFACICPCASDTELLKTISDETVLRADQLRDFILPRMCTPSQMAEGFTKLLRLPSLNGALLMFKNTSFRFVKMEYVSLGEDWTPSQ